MATVHSHLNAFDPSLDDLPTWKKELILRRRANAGRIHGGMLRLGQGPSQLSLRSVPGPSESLSSVHGSNESVRSVHGVSAHQFDANEVRSKLFTASSGEPPKNISPEGCDSEVCEIVGNPQRIVIDTSAMRGPCSMHHKGLPSLEAKSSLRSSSGLEDSEEFQYGPGIVSRLKDRYMSLALREARGRASLRKYSSLEDLLDEGPLERGRSSLKGGRALPGGGGGTSCYKKEVMKRARSMDSLSVRRSDGLGPPKSKSSGALRQALQKDDVIIIESLPRPSENGAAPVPKAIGRVPLKKAPAPLVEEEELPTPDIVKQVKRMFEPPARSAPRGKAVQKPPLKAKPAQLRPLSSHSGVIENARSSLRTVQGGGRPAFKAPLVHMDSGESGGSPSPTRVSLGLTPITASVTAPHVNGVESPDLGGGASTPRPHSPPTPLPPSPTPAHKEEKDRVLRENLKNKGRRGSPPPRRSESPNSPHFEGKRPHVPSEASKSEAPTLASSPAPAPPDTPMELTPSPPRPKDSPSPSSSPALIPSTVLDVIRAAEAKTQSSADSPVGGVRTPTRGKDSQGVRRPPPKQESSSLMFNFSKRAETPDYIENDGVDLSKRHFKPEPGYVIMPGYDGKLDSSTDADEDAADSPCGGSPPPPCNITFLGEGVIIKGRSNLQRQPRTKKLEVSFDMPSTRTFEYPSESCLEQEFDDFHKPATDATDEAIPFVPSIPTVGGLASYTPSKLPLSAPFELGISRSMVPCPPTPPKGRESLEEELLRRHDHLRPADEDEAVTWSAESVPDMLF